jgi:general stress protein YciG
MIKKLFRKRQDKMDVKLASEEIGRMGGFEIAKDDPKSEEVGRMGGLEPSKDDPKSEEVGRMGGLEPSKDDPKSEEVGRMGGLEPPEFDPTQKGSDEEKSCKKLRETLVAFGTLCAAYKPGEASPIPCDIFIKTFVSYIKCSGIPSSIYSDSELEDEIEKLLDAKLKCNDVSGLLFIISNYNLCTGEAKFNPLCKKWQLDVKKLLNCIPPKEYPVLSKILDYINKSIPEEEEKSNSLPIRSILIVVLLLFVLSRR